MKKAILILTAGLLAAGSMAASAVAAQVDYEEFWGPYSTNPETEDHYLFQINPDSLLLYWEHEEPELFQTITFPAPLPDVEFCLERMKTSDLNHDGYEDLCIPSTMDETPPFLKNYCYLWNPETRQFDYHAGLSEIVGLWVNPEDGYMIGEHYGETLRQKISVNYILQGEMVLPVFTSEGVCLAPEDVAKVALDSGAEASYTAEKDGIIRIGEIFCQRFAVYGENHEFVTNLALDWDYNWYMDEGGNGFYHLLYIDGEDCEVQGYADPMVESAYEICESIYPNAGAELKLDGQIVVDGETVCTVFAMSVNGQVKGRIASADGEEWYYDEKADGQYKELYYFNGKMEIYDAVDARPLA